MATKTENCADVESVKTALNQLKLIEKTVAAEQKILKYEIENMKSEPELIHAY
tara:strand:- start:360 stop:518 length:159 start_codon:yes stop_codon:yes gene_type:complete